MKKQTMFLALAVLTSCIGLGQSIGIGTNSTHNSAILDITSNNKGMLTPRMTTAQRNAIAAPAKGLLVFDTDFNSFWFYNGSAWSNLSAGGGGSFSLPFESTINTNVAGFKINNAGSGASLSGSTSNDFGIGIAGIANSNFGWGINGFARSPLAIAVYANADSATALKATSNEGLAIEASSIKKTAIKAYTANGNPAIEASNSAGSAIVANTSWNGTAIAAVKGISTGFNSAGIYGENNNTTGIGVKGITNGDNHNAMGVMGVANTYNTVGVAGIASHSVSFGVYARNTNGTALYAESVNDKALEINGKLKIAGGNTNPSRGAVLTSDETGNAVWKNNKIAFKTGLLYSPLSTLANEQNSKIHFNTALVDYHGDFELTTASNPPATASTFKVPVDGVYQFNVSGTLRSAQSEDFEEAFLNILRTRNGSTEVISSTLGSLAYGASGLIDVYDDVAFSISTTEKLQAGDRIWLNIWQKSGNVASAGVVFSGHLVFAD